MHDGETLANILSGKHMPLEQRGVEMPAGLAEVIERMLSVTPDSRFPNMDAVLDALDPFTPPLTAHRELAELVLRARPAQTIVMQDGVFVSKPVAHENLVREPTPRGGRRRTDSGPHKSERGSGSSPRSERGSASSPRLPFGPLSEPLGPGVHTHTQPAMGSASRTALQVEVDDSSYERRTRSGNGRLQALFAGVGALVLGALSWVVFSADSWSTSTNRATPPGASVSNAPPPSLGPKLPPNGASDSSDSQGHPISTAVAPPSAAGFPATGAQGAGTNTGTGANSPADAARKAEPTTAEPASPPAETKPRRAARERDKDKAKDKDRDKDNEKDRDRASDGSNASAPAKSSKNNAIARVRVFPWGRVWVDGKLQGSVPPILEVNLSPGAHEIAVGHERPMESRSVTLSPGATQLVAFDLEGR
jgi:hypothetical protein